jgi:hypothetical protein
MAQKLFPILADPNAPSLFTGLDVSIVAGQITAVDGADSFNMTASTLSMTNDTLNTTYSNDGVFVNTGQLATGSFYSELIPRGLNVIQANCQTTIRPDAVEVVGLDSNEGIRSKLRKSDLAFNNELTNVNSSLSNIQLSLATVDDTATFSASTLTANGVSALWADIVDGVVNPPALQNLQSVLDTGHTASGVNAFADLYNGSDILTLKPEVINIEGANAEEIFQATRTAMSIVNATETNTFTASSVALTGDGSANLSVSTLAMTYSQASSAFTANSASFAYEGGFATSGLSSVQLAFNGVGDNMGKIAEYRYDGASIIAMDGANLAITAIVPNSVALTGGSVSNTMTSAGSTLSTSTLGSAHSADAVIFTTTQSPVISSSLGLFGLSVVNDTLQTTLTSSSLSISGNNSEVSTVNTSQHSIQDANYSAVLTPASMAITLLADPTDNATMTVSDLIFMSGTAGSTLTPTDQSFSTPSANAVYSATGAVITGTGITSTLSAESLSLVNVDPTKSTTLNSTSLTVLGANSSSTMLENLVGVGYGNETATMQKDRMKVQNATVSTSIIETGMTSGDATYNMEISAPTAETLKATFSSSESIQLNSSHNIELKAGSSTLAFNQDDMIADSAGGSTNKYLNVVINNVSYCISLLAISTAPPTPFPFRTISRINIGGGQNIFVQEPYIQWDNFNIFFTVSGFSGATDSSSFEILSYPTDAYQPNVYYSLRKVFINGNGDYSFSVPNLTPERYNAIQFFQTSANAFTVSYFIINGTQQIASPNPVPLVCPPV